jgi:imidazolonepropionase-like amidohydrolase
MVTGTDSGFAVTPYGEWHARELEIFVRHLGFTPAEALQAATAVPARLLAGRLPVGVLEAGRAADFIVVEGSPLEDITLLQDPGRIHAVHLGGRRIDLPAIDYDPRAVSDLSWYSWTDLYTRDRVAALRRTRALAAE